MPPASRSAAGSLVRGRPSAMLIKPEQTEGDGCPADELATTRTVAVGMSQRPPGHQEQEQRCRVRERADQRWRHPTWIAVAHGAGQTEPELGGDDDRTADQEQPDPVPPQGRVEITGAGADRAGRRADQVSEAEPEGEQSPTDPGQQGRSCCLARALDDPEREEPERDEPDRDEPEREAGARDGVFLAGPRLPLPERALVPPRGAPERAGVLDLVLLPDDRGGEPAPVEVLALARDRGGEDARVAMGGEPTPSPHPSLASRAGS